MLFFPVFVHPESRRAKLQSGSSPDLSLRARVRSLPRLQNPVCIQTLIPSPQPRAIPSSFLFNPFRTLFSPRRTTALNNPFGIKWFRTLSRHNGGIPLSRSLDRLLLLQSPLFPVVHPIYLQPLTKCSSRNSFPLTTIHFHGGCIPPCAPFYFPLSRHAPAREMRALARKQGGGEGQLFC
jgi:hypothetical protein